MDGPSAGSGQGRDQARGRVVDHVLGQVTDAEPARSGQHHRPLNDVLELPHVARIGVLAQGQKRVLREPHDLLCGLLGLHLEEVVGEGRDVAGPLAEGRQPDHHHVDAVVEVLAELAGGHELLERLVAGQDHPHVDLDGLVGSHRLEGAILHHP